jgi:hypothetical protein
VGPTTSLESVERKKTLSLPGTEPQPSCLYPGTIPTELSQLLSMLSINQNIYDCIASVIILITSVTFSAFKFSTAWCIKLGLSSLFRVIAKPKIVFMFYKTFTHDVK